MSDKSMAKNYAGGLSGADGRNKTRKGMGNPS